MNYLNETEKAYKFGAGRCHISHGASFLAGEEAAHMGCRKAYIIAGNTAFAIAGSAVCTSLKSSGIQYEIALYAGYCSIKQAMDYASRAKAFGADIIIGIGGGRILDLSKMTACVAGCRIMTVPTVSATSAAFTHMCVMYMEDGHWDGTKFLPDEVDCVLADMDFLCEQPERYLTAGIVDAMAKCMEIRHPRKSQGNETGDYLMASVIADHVFERLYMLAQLSASERKERDLWEMCFLSMAGAAFVSGVARCDRQSAVAHAFYEWTKRCRKDEVSPFLHGEIIGVGLMIQGLYNENEMMLNKLKQTLRALKMPRLFSEIGLEKGKQDAQAAAEWLIHSTGLIAKDREESFCQMICSIA